MDLEPPVPLTIAARRTWDRIAKRIHGEGRWPHISTDMLVVFCETVELYEACKQEVDTHGVLVEGRTTRELVRNPALTPLNQARAALVHLARSVPLTDSKPDHNGSGWDAFLDQMLSQ
jgi:P27 family predicted phage terminase small subunit